MISDYWIKTVLRHASLGLWSVLLMHTPAQGANVLLSGIEVTPVDPALIVGQSRMFLANGQFSDGSTRQLLGAPVRSVGAGETHSCALLTNGTVHCWGSNSEGQLGNGTKTNSNVPVTVAGVNTATWLGIGYFHGCAVGTGGGVQCWGRNIDGELGNGTTAGSTTAVKVSGIRTAKTVAAAYSHSCAVLTSGAVKCWGDNYYGQLGNGKIHTRSTTPVSVSGISTAKSVAVGENFSCALLTSGAVKCWGVGAYGQLGNGKNLLSSTPVMVSGINTATALAAGQVHSCAVLKGGTVKCWGYNYYGELGNGTTGGESLTPITVLGINTATAVRGGYFHSCAMIDGGGVLCWGNNESGELGDGTTSDSNTPVAVGGIIASRLTAGASHTCALLTNGKVKCWGDNYDGQLGNGLNGYSEFANPFPVSVIGTPAVIVNWNSSNTSVASINTAGVAVGLKAGSTVIKASAKGIKGSTILTVKGGT